MSSNYAFDKKLLGKLEIWMKNRNLSSRTIENYLIYLRSLPDDVETYFARDFPGKRNKIAAYRSYLKFLQKEKIITREELLDALETYLPPKKRGNGRSKSKWS
ncbi:MAG: hypothetical protein ACTSRU_19950, partial [Candidatus Hodarchaeales archaeon]